MTLDQYRDLMMAIAHQNSESISKDPKWTDKQKAGTALLVAVHAASFAAELCAKTDPRMKNAPFEAKLDEMFDLLRATIIEKKKPDLTVVRGGS